MSSIHSDSSQSGTAAFPLELCKPKVALVIDARNWAFHNSARQMQKHLSDRFDVTILSALDVGEIHRVLMLTADYDLVHFFWRAHLAHLVSEEGRRGIEALGLDSDAFLEDFAHRVSITSGVFDHLFLDPPLPFLQDISNAFVAFDTVYSVSSLKLDNIYRNLPGYGPPRAVLQDGVDLQLFKPQSLHRLVEPPRRKLVVGWVGNSAWGEDTEDFKGVHTILRPAIDELVAKGFPIELMLSDRQNGVIPHSEMPQFYGCIDVYVCVSKFEGTPNPILEAMACGLAVISTDVGIVREAFGTLQTEFILEHRSVLHLQTALTRLLVEPALLKRLSDENLDSIKCWDWRLKAAAYGRFFDAAIELRLAREPMGRMTPVVASEQPYTGFLSGEDSMWRHLDDECSQNESVVAPIVDAEWLKENVVVCMLFFNKLEQTIESAESFLAAGVRLHLLDNGSTPSAAEYLRAHFADHPRVRIVAASSNKGVSGGRNMQLHDTQEPWLFYIDNDITVATPDWLERMAVAIQSNPQAQIFVPRLFNKHEDSWSPMSDFVVDQEGHCVFVATEADYANAYPGGASLIARTVLEQLGGYDERLFVGFEDFELALRAWRRGSPLLVRYVEDIVLIHDHRASVSNADKETAKVRYDQGHISHSHEMIRSTHGVLLNPNFGDWLIEQVRQLTGAAPEHASAQTYSEHVLADLTIRPRACPVRTKIDVIVDGSQPDVWLSLRAVALARARAIEAEILVTVRVVDCSSSILAQARLRGLVDDGAQGDGSRPDFLEKTAGAPNLFTPDCELVCWVGAGLISEDFLVQIAQNAALDPAETFRVFHPGRLIIVAEDGTGFQLEHVRVFDPFELEHLTVQVPVFAFHRELAWRFWDASSRLGSCPSMSATPHLDQQWNGDRALRLLARMSAAGHENFGIPDSLTAIRLSVMDVLMHKRMLIESQCLGATVRDYTAWVPWAQNSLRPIALHAEIASFDWNSLPVIKQRGASFLDSAVTELLQSELERGTTHVLLVPWLKRGGADQAAIYYVQSLVARMPGQVLVIATEHAESAWAARLPTDVRLIEWADVAAWRSAEHCRKNLAWMLARLGPSMIHVMNSCLGWQMLAYEGKRLNAVSYTYASLFWYGPSRQGKLRGYAPEYAERVAREGAVDAFLTDNDSFPRRLNEDYGIAPTLFHCVRHPTSYFVEAAVRGPTEGGGTVLWASRFAPEKRMDLLLQIAVQRPAYKFLVYGSNDDLHPEIAEIEAALRGLPNVTLAGAYDTFGSLPTQQSDVFLYTSSSDGMPNVTIEALAHGLALVASDVGGVAELVDESTGWLVREIDDAPAYLTMLDQALQDPEERFRRAKNGLARVRLRHSPARFSQRLLEIPGYMGVPYIDSAD